MGSPAATGRGTSRIDATRARDLAPRPMVPALPQQGWAACLFLHAVHPIAQHSMGTGGRGESPALKHGAVCTNCLAKNRTACASNVFIGTINLPPITRESPLSHSAHKKTPAVGRSRPRFSK